MTTGADLNAKFDRMVAAMSNIAADIRNLAGQIGTGMSQADVDAANARAETIASTLESLAAETPDVPPTA